jgi:hypothetical protein
MPHSSGGALLSEIVLARGYQQIIIEVSQAQGSTELEPQLYGGQDGAAASQLPWP